MMSEFHDLTSSTRFIAAIGCGIVGGAFFAFSTFVMKSLSRLPAEQGMAAMQAINVAVLRSWFLFAILATAVLCLATVVLTLPRWGEPAAICWLAGAALYLAGTFLVTVLFNVPMNNTLAALSPTSREGAACWATYLKRWTMWNHVRTLASLAAMALLMIARK